MAYRPIVYLSGVLAELPTGIGYEVMPQQFAVPTVTDLADGQLAIDTTTQDLILRIGNNLYRFSKSEQIQSYVAMLNFNNPTFSHWIPTL